MLAAAALAVSAALVWRGVRGAWLRVLSLALLLLALCDPNLIQENRRPLKDIVAVVVDRSESQSIGERPRQTDKVRDELEARLKAMGNVDLRVVETSRDESETEGTKLFAALRGALADAPPERIGGAIMITDGDAHDIPQSAAALGFNGPLHALITGHEGERQRRIELVEAPRYGIVGKDQVIEARVLDSADHGEPVELTVRRDGATIATMQARVGERIDVRAPIDHPGPNVIELEVAPVQGEIAADSNRAVVNIEGVRDKLRVLLVSGKPHPGERMWRNLLKSDANVDLVHFTILRPPEKGADGTPINELSLIAFPVADLFGRRIKDFDLIIFDRYAQQSILPYVYLENIANYVRDGGALLMAEGPEFSTPDGLYYSPLGAISPAEPSGDDVERPYRARVSSEGQRHPVTRGLSGFNSNNGDPNWGRWFRIVGAKPTNGVTVMSGADDKPLLVLSRVDKGRVGLLLSDQMWLWARGYDGGGPYVDLLRRLAHWLMKEPDLEEEALRASAKGREVTVERQSVSGEARDVSLVASDGSKTKLDMTPLCARSQPRASNRQPVRPLSRRGRRTRCAGQRRPGESSGNARCGVDHRKAASDRRGDRRHGASHLVGRGRCDHDATRRWLEPVPKLRRGRLHWGQADRINGVDGRPFDVACLGVLRPGASPRYGHSRLGERERRPETQGRRGLADERLVGLLPIGQMDV